MRYFDARGTEQNKVAIKVYIVLQLVIKEGPISAPNVKVAAVRLTRRAANDLAEGLPRSWVERFIATK